LEEKDTFKTIATESNEILFKEKNSKFYGYAFPVINEVEIKILLEKLRKKHSTAGHFCYAFQIGTDTLYYRVNDDGEPSNSAGMPIYGQIQSFGLTNVLVVVVRYFGGIKLGVGGLISSYRTAAQLALDESEIIEKTVDILFQISFDYKNMNKVMRIIKEKNLTIISQNMTEYCQIVVSIRKKNAEIISESFKTIFEVAIKKI
jgi:uncharacterized YigZ family protein